MTDSLHAAAPPAADRARSVPCLRGLPAGAEALPAEVLLGDVPWDGPTLDPTRLDARSLLARLR